MVNAADSILVTLGGKWAEPNGVHAGAGLCLQQSGYRHCLSFSTRIARIVGWGRHCDAGL
ncbi:Uncharacterised protein [Vibrio cholerae]|nr:Uncharacterised protein [Vibrio cholerae]CSI56036.1 Uncharacterised protein [Vibrio cholerae]